MKERIRQIMEAQHMSQQLFAEFIGTTPATLSGIFNDRTKPTLNIVEAIKKKIPDINTDWLMFGSGSMYLDAVPSMVQQQVATQARQQSDNRRQAGTPATSVTDQMIDFDPIEAPAPSVMPQRASHTNGVRNTPQIIVRDDMKYFDKPPRRVTEIRVYYDDQTWESFVPSKK